VADGPCRRGLLALGDSITNGLGSMALGVTPQSWAQWLAEALGLPFRNLAVDGATTTDVVAHQLPQVTGDWDVACLYAGVNDVRSADWDQAAYGGALRRALVALRERAPVLVCATIPRDLGRPRAGAKVDEANAVVRAAARESDAVLVALEDLRGWHLVLPDAVHPTAVGQAAMAERAARALAAAGVPVPRSPWALAEVDRTLAGALRHLPAHGAALVRQGARRVREGTLPV
jgi:lysophospholipase L1-like esterase